MEEVRQEVLKAVEEAAQEGRLTCERAHQLAAALGVPLIEVGRAADLLGIKIRSCQLGCF